MSDPFRTFRAGMRWFHRVWWKLLLGGVGFVLLLSGLWLYGLRYGFVPLPKPPPGFTLNYPPLDAMPLDQATNGWAVVPQLRWPRQSIIDKDCLEDLIAGRVGKLDPYSAEITVTNFTHCCDLIEADWTSSVPPEELAKLLRQPDQFARQIVFPPGQTWEEFLDLYIRIIRLKIWNGALAGRALEQGGLAEALDRIVTIFALSAGSTSAAGGNPRCLEAVVPLTLLVAISPQALTSDEIRKQLAALDRAAELLPALEDCYRASVALQLPDGPCYFFADPDHERSWRSWFTLTRDEVGSLWDGLKALPEQLLLKVAGSKDELGWPRFDFDDVGGMFLQTLAWNVVRPKDVARVVLATAAEGLARIKRAKSQRSEDLEQARGTEERETEWWWLFNQPFPRVAASRADDLKLVASMRADYLRDYEFCRLLLALRLRRDTLGHWPDRLEELTPEVLDQLPIDPVTGRPFRYRRHGAHWLLWVADNQGRNPDDWQFQETCLSSARCLLRFRDLKSLLKDEGSEQFFRNTPHLDDLLKLLPKRATSVARRPSEERLMERYGLLPSGEAISGE